MNSENRRRRNKEKDYRKDPITGRRVLVPTFEIQMGPTIRIEDIRNRRLPLIIRDQRLGDAIYSEEAEIFRVLGTINEEK